MTWEQEDWPPTVPSGEQEHAGKTRSRQRAAPPPARVQPPPTFAFVSRVAGEGVSIETILAAVTEEAVGVVDALQTLSGLPVAVPNSVGVNVLAALAGATRSDRPPLTQRVPEEAVVTELTALTWGVGGGGHSQNQGGATSEALLWFLREPHQDSPVVPAGQLVHTTSLLLRMTAQVAPSGQGHGRQSAAVPPLASP